MPNLKPAVFALSLLTLFSIHANAEENPFANLNDPINPKPAEAATGGALADISKLSDEFKDEKSLANWRQVSQDEKWTESQIETLDVNKTQTDCLALIPFTSGWYRDYRGVLLYKPIEGDFVITTHLRVTGRDGRSAPQRSFSLAGIMARAPRNVTQETWRPGGENYLFATMGAGSNAGRYNFEMKDTVNSNSRVLLSDAAGAEGYLQIARIGSNFLLLVRTPEGAWQVRQRFSRPDLPTTLQVGMTAYTDWPTVERLQPRDANTRRLEEGRPDVLALFDYMRFTRPQVPATLRGAALADARVVSDAQLLQFLGESANQAAK